MSEASTQKLLVTMVCVFGVVVVLIGYGRQRNRSFERMPLESRPAIATHPTKPASSLDQLPTTGRIISKGNRDSAQWQSTPATNPMPANAYTSPAWERPSQDSFYDQQRSVKNYSSATTNSAPQPLRAVARHPSAQKIAQRDHQWQQRPHRASPHLAQQQTLHTQPAIPFHDFGNVGHAVATKPVTKQNSNVRHAADESQIPQPDLFTTQRQPARSEASPKAVSVLKTQSANQFAKSPTNDQAIDTDTLSGQVPSVNQSGIAMKAPVSATSSARVDRQVRKANWTEIEATPKVDPMHYFRPLQQTTLQQRNAKPQVESAAREQIQYGQSLARRRAYFAAREEFIRALLSIASSYNAESNSTAHPERLAQGLIAVDEMGDFSRASGSLLQQKILAHSSQLLTPQDIATTSPVQAMSLYSNFAQSQIVQAIGTSAAGSEALHALGKLESMVPEADRNKIKTLVFYQAAVKIDPTNSVCANDLGVLLFNMGRLEESEKALIAALGSTQSQLSWNNLALVHRQRAANAGSEEQRDRQLSLANLAAQQAEKFAIKSGNGQPISDGLNPNQWATPQEFQTNAAFPNDVVQHANSRPNPSKPAGSRSATLKQKMKDWF